MALQLLDMRQHLKQSDLGSVKPKTHQNQNLRDNMAQHKNMIDGRKIWLQECLLTSTNTLLRMEQTEVKRKLTPREASLKQVAAAYLYLYHKVQEEGLLRPGDEDNFFKNETLH